MGWEIESEKCRQFCKSLSIFQNVILFHDLKPISIQSIGTMYFIDIFIVSRHEKNCKRAIDASIYILKLKAFQLKRKIEKQCLSYWLIVDQHDVCFVGLYYLGVQIHKFKNLGHEFQIVTLLETPFIFLSNTHLQAFESLQMQMIFKISHTWSYQISSLSFSEPTYFHSSNICHQNLTNYHISIEYQMW